jgi:putative ABC transport system permease protein
MFDVFWQDVRYASRTLWNAPLFTVTAVLSLAIGIAGNAAVFSLADAVVFRGRPGISERTQLVDVGRTDQGAGFDTVSYPNYLDYRTRNLVFEGLAAYRDGEPFALTTTGGDATRVFGGQVSANYFDVLGVPMALGRGFLPDEERVGDPRLVLVISDSLWRSHLRADPDIVGRSVRVNGQAYTVVGVAGGGFSGNSLARETLWVPLTTYPEGNDLTRLTRRQGTWLMMVGRLRPEVTLAQARADVERIARDLEREYPEANRGRGVALARQAVLPPAILRRVGGFIGILFGFVVLILMIACTNVGGMLLARGYARSHEVAVRLAIGGSRAGVVRLLAIESVLLALCGAVVGLVVGWGAIQLLPRSLPALPIDVALDLRLDLRVMTFSVVVALAAGTLCGVIPAWQTVRANLVRTIKPDGGGSPRRLRLRYGLLAAQIAMSALLLVCALLLTRSLRNANEIETGFTAEHVDLAVVSLQLGNYDEGSGTRLVDEMVTRIEQVPGVEKAGASAVVPLMFAGVSRGALWVPKASGDPAPLPTDWNMVTPGYFAAIGIPLQRGRAFTKMDVQGAPEVAIVNETFARRAWRDEDAIGQTLLYGPNLADARKLEVIGIARDAKYRSLGEDPRPFLYVPFAQQYRSDVWLMVRRGRQTVIPAIRSIVHQLAPDLPVVQATTLVDATAVGLMPYRVAAWLAGVVATIGILLAAIGIYGVTSFNVAQRTREIGIRVALGALGGDVMRMIMRQALAVASAGALVGLAGAALAAQLLASLLFGLRPLDPVSFGLGALVLITMAIVASVLPARRATRVDPVIALRAE